MADQTPMTDAELEEVRRRVTADVPTIVEGFEGAWTFTEQGRVWLGAVTSSGRRLLAEVDRLRKYEPMALEYIDLHAKACAERDALAAKLDAVRGIRPRGRSSALMTSEHLATLAGWNDACAAIRTALGDGADDA